MDPLMSLNVDLAGHDATRPIIPPSDQPLVIADIKVDDNKDKTGKNLIVEFQTTQPITSTRGKPVQVGTKLTNYYPLQASQKQIEAGTPLAFKDRIALLLDAAFNTGESNRPNLNTDTAIALKGKVVLASISIDNDPQYGEQNRVGTLKPLV